MSYANPRLQQSTAGRQARWAQPWRSGRASFYSRCVDTDGGCVCDAITDEPVSTEENQKITADGRLAINETRIHICTNVGRRPRGTHLHEVDLGDRAHHHTHGPLRGLAAHPHHDDLR